MTDPSREAFEKHVLTENGIVVRGLGWITRDNLGVYAAADIQARWLTWQAAMAHKEIATRKPSGRECCGGFCGGKRCEE